MTFDFEEKVVWVNNSKYSLTNDLSYIGDYSGQKPYLRRTTKISIYKQLMKNNNDFYQTIRECGWYQPYKNEVEDTPNIIIPDEVKNIMKEPKEETKVDMSGFENALNKLGDKLGDMAIKIDAMNTNTKLEDALIEGIVSKGKELATEELEKDIKDRLDSFIKTTYGILPQKIEITNKEITYDKTGIFHKDFEKVLKLVNMNLPVMLTGGAGAGKNFMLEQVANALGLDFYYTSTITQEYKLTGFIDGGGKYHETEFYKAFTQGGVFMLDEIDASIPECLVILNGAIANGYFDFPTGREIANENFRVVCAGNTVGLGADLVYTGRNVIDGATLDRFVLVEIDYDKRIEENLCQDEKLRDFLYDIRASIKHNHINHIIGMRCFKYAYQMLQNGFDKEFIVKSVVLKGLQKDDINVIKCGLKDSEWSRYVK